MNYDECRKLILEIGDKVTLYYNNGAMCRAILIHRPQGEGDIWEFYDEDQKLTFAQNPYSSSLNFFEKRREV